MYGVPTTPPTTLLRDKTVFKLNRWRSKRQCRTVQTAPAGAGETPRFIRVASMHEVRPGTGKLVTMMGRDIGLFNVGGRIEAIDNTCPHNQRPIGTDGIRGSTVTCFWHNLTFELESGICTEAPHFKIRKYLVRVRKQEIYVSPGSRV